MKSNNKESTSGLYPGYISGYLAGPGVLFFIGMTAIDLTNPHRPIGQSFNGLAASTRG